MSRSFSTKHVSLSSSPGILEQNPKSQDIVSCMFMARSNLFVLSGPIHCTHFAPFLEGLVDQIVVVDLSLCRHTWNLLTSDLTFCFSLQSKFSESDPTKVPCNFACCHALTDPRTHILHALLSSERHERSSSTSASHFSRAESQ